MKNKYLLIVLLLGFTGMFTIQSCTKDESPTPMVYKADVPSVPTPAVGGVVKLAGTTYVLKWEGTTGSVDLYIGKDEPSAKPIKVTGKSYTFTATEGGEYFWYLETVDANGITSSSVNSMAKEPWNFFINSPPTAPVLTVPIEAAVAVSSKIALTWTATDAEDADHLTYNVFVGKSAESLSLVATGLTAATYSPTLAYATKYFWQVIAVDPHGETTSSAVHSFTTDVFRPDFTVFNGLLSEVSTDANVKGTNSVFVKTNTTTHVITLYLPLADGLVSAGFGTVYSGSHPVAISYDPITFAITGAKQLWMDSFIDPTEMGPMFLTVKSGTIDATKKTLTIVWILSGNAGYFGADFTLKSTTYTVK